LVTLYPNESGTQKMNQEHTKGTHCMTEIQEDIENNSALPYLQNKEIIPPFTICIVS